jgi:hypothetical protein
MDAGLEADLIACEEACNDEKLKPRQALKLIQKLHVRRLELMAAARPGKATAISEGIEPYSQERAS